MRATKPGPRGADVARRAVAAAATLAAAIVVHRFAPPDPVVGADAAALLALGVALLAAYTLAGLAEVLRVPPITGALVAGVLLGAPAAKLVGAWVSLPPPLRGGLLDDASLSRARALELMALPVLLLLAGARLDGAGLRERAGVLGGVLLGQTVAVVSAMALLVWVGSGAIDVLVVPGLAGLPPAAVWPLGGLLGALALSSSVPAVLGVLHTADAEGPQTRTALDLAVLKDLAAAALFVLCGYWAAAALGAPRPTGALVATAAASVGVGMASAGALVALTRAAPDRPTRALAVAGLIGVGGGSWAGADLGLVGLTAGTTLGAAGAAAAVAPIARLTTPALAVAFLLLGARLPLAPQLFGLGAALAVARAVALALGSLAGATATGADPVTRRFVWTSALPQAGLVVAFAPWLEVWAPGYGAAVLGLVMSAVLLNELVGPTLLQAALGLVGETASAREGDAARCDVGRRRAMEVERDPDDPWGPPCESPSAEIVGAVEDLQHDVQAAARAWLAGPPVTTQSRDLAWIASLRRELLRAHRRSAALARAGNVTAEALDGIYRELAEAWRGQVLRRSARPESGLWDLTPLVTEIDRAIERAPTHHRVTVTAAVLAGREEGAWRALRRSVLRLRHRVRTVRHDVALQDLARYHLGGRALRHLEGVAALGMRCELDLAEYVGQAFAAATRGWSRVAHLVADGAAPDAIDAAVWEVRAAVEAELSLAQEASTAELEGAQRRAAAVLGRALRDVKAETLTSGTLDLPHRLRRFSRVYNERTIGLTAMTAGLADARATLAARYAGLALDMEVAALQVEVSDAVERHGAALARMADELGARQLSRARDAVGEALEAMRAALDAGGIADDAVSRLRAAAEPAQRQLAESVRLVARVQEQLSEEAAIAPLRDALLSAGRGLTDWYAVPTAPIPAGDWSLPPATPTAEVHLRETALAFIETRVAAELLGIVREEGRTFHSAHEALMELERSLTLHVDLATAELDVHRGSAPPASALALAADLLLGNVGRAQTNLTRAIDAVGHRGRQIREAVRDLVHTHIARLRELSAPPREGSELRRVVLRDAATSRAGLTTRLERVVGAAAKSLTSGAIAAWQGARGEAPDRDDVAPDQADAETFAPLRPRAELPMVYRRLFSDQGLGSTDLLVGRRLEIARAASALGRSARLRTVAVIGAPGAGKGTLAAAIWRQLGGSAPHLLRLDAPPTLDDIDGWFTGRHDRIQLDGLRWLFHLQPGGAAALEHFVARLVQDEGRIAWIFAADGPVWRAATALAPLAAATAEVIDVKPLTVEELEQAVLARHAMSNYRLRFDPPAGAWDRLRDRLQRHRRQRRWFEALHARTGGAMVDALRLWLGSLHDVDAASSTMQVGPLPRSRLGALRRLSDDDLLVLRHGMRQGRLTAELVVAAWLVDLGSARATLAGLQARGLLEPDGDTLRVARHLRTVVLKVLTERGWAP
jgi:hypothetical protein